LPDQFARRGPEPASAKEKPLFADPFELPAPHSIPEHEEFGIELAIPADASPDVIRLRQRQRAVLEILMIGKSIRAAAQMANVSRATLYRWMRSDEEFKAALKAWQERAQTTARSKLLCATEKAADVIIKKLDDGDLRAALAILTSARAPPWSRKSTSTNPAHQRKPPPPSKCACASCCCRWRCRRRRRPKPPCQSRPSRCRGQSHSYRRRRRTSRDQLGRSRKSDTHDKINIQAGAPRLAAESSL